MKYFSVAVLLVFLMGCVNTQVQSAKAPVTGALHEQPAKAGAQPEYTTEAQDVYRKGPDVNASNQIGDGQLVSSSDDHYSVCPQKRSKICNKKLQPVCASRAKEVHCVMAPCPEIYEEVTYSNGCMACADPLVSKYRVGACENTMVEQPTYQQSYK